MSAKAPVILYYHPLSPPCRTIMLLAKCIGLELDLKLINLMEGEHLKSDFLKINPQHVVPTLDDNGFVIWESRAVLCYFINAYAKDDSLYPREPKARARVDFLLYFNMGTLYLKFAQCFYPVLFYGAADIEEANLEKLKEVVGFLEDMLDGKDWLAGDTISIADIDVVVTVSNFEPVGFDISGYPNISAWFDRTKRALTPYGYEEINTVGVNLFKQCFEKQ